jgi:hypothetical protein
MMVPSWLRVRAAAPAALHHAHTIADWPDCHLELHCPQCGKMTFTALRMFRLGYGGTRVLDLVAKLRCSACGVPAAPLYLVAGQTRSFTGGPSPDWAIELVPAPKAAS